MPIVDNLQELNTYIVQYGYITIFLFVFLQELGIPNPITNELVLLFSGYITYTGTLSITKVILTAVSADFMGTTILYFIFYSLGKRYLFKNTPRWLTKFVAKLDKLRQRINERKKWSIFIGRLTPFLRGYISVAAGLLQIKPKIFLSTVLLSAVIWSGSLTLTGKLLGPYWTELVQKVGAIKFAVLIILLIVALIIAGKYITRKEFSKKTKTA
jgi:membrane protein DedA with SNARE-associated domain